MNVAFVGGGNACKTLLSYFLRIEGLRVVGVSDPRANAPGIEAARRQGIPTFTSSSDLLTDRRVQLVVELTGNEEIRQQTLGLLKKNQEIMTAAAARLMCEMILAQQEIMLKNTQHVDREFAEIEQELGNSTDNIDRAHREIGDVLKGIALMTINAGIEAARIGAAGDAFKVVADRMHEMVGQIRETMTKVQEASESNRLTIQRLQSTKAGLQAALQSM